MSSGVLGDPYYRDNDVNYRWVAKEDWAYTCDGHARTHVHFPAR